MAVREGFQDRRLTKAIVGAIGLANGALDKSRTLKLEADKSCYPSLAEIEEMNKAGFQFVFSQDGMTGQFVPKKG